MRDLARLILLVLIAAWASPVLAGPVLAGHVSVAPTSVGGGQAHYDDLIGKSRSAMLADPAEALGLARKAVDATAAIANERQRQLAQSQGHWLEAEALNRTGSHDQAETVAQAALRVVEQVDPGSKLDGDLLATIGQIARAKGDVVTALDRYQRAFGIFETKGEHRSQA